MTTAIENVASAYVAATNQHDADAFAALFQDDAVVDDNGREFRGLAAIREWSEREIFGASVTLDVLKTAEQGGDFVVTTIVDGNFDRTGLPNPVVIEHRLKMAGSKIAALTCRLATS